MHSNKSLVFYLANEDTGEKPSDTQVQSEQNTEKLLSEPVSVNSQTVLTELTPTSDSTLMVDSDWFLSAQTTVSSVEAPEVSQTIQELKEVDEALAALKQQSLLAAKNQELDDWIADLEKMRNRRRQIVAETEIETDVQADVQTEPLYKQFRQVEHSALAGVLKVTSVKATQLYQPAARVLATGKDLDSLNHNMQEAKNKASKVKSTLVATQPVASSEEGGLKPTLAKNEVPVEETSVPMTSAQTSQEPSFEVTAPSLEKQPIQSAMVIEKDLTSSPSSHSAHTVIEPVAAPKSESIFALHDDKQHTQSLQAKMVKLKNAAKQVPIETLYEPPTAVANTVSETKQTVLDTALRAKAEELAEKTGLTPEEREQILDGFLNMWQQKRDQSKTAQSERKIAFKEQWHERNESILQTDSNMGEKQADTVMWLKTDSIKKSDLEPTSSVESAVVPEIMAQLPPNLPSEAMYAPIHVHINMPVLADDESISIISEAQLVSQLTERLKPYFVDMLSGLVKTELTKQTHLLVQRLQENIAAEIPLMVDELLQENVQKVLHDIKDL